MLTAAPPVQSSSLLAALVATLVTTRLLGEAAQRLGQPSVLGELLAGVLLGVSALGVLDPAAPVIAALAELGILVLLFEIGLHTDVRALAGVAGTAATVAGVGVLLPFGMGWGAARLLGVAPLAAVVCGAALTATSIGISARVLSDLGWLGEPEGQVVLGAAVLDDVVGLVILAVVSAAVAGGAMSAGRVARTAGAAVLFIALALLVGGRLAPPVLRLAERARSDGALAVVALAFALAMAWGANAAGSAPIIGAFAAGLVLHPTPQREEIERTVSVLGHFFVPVFFASVGAAVRLDALADPGALRVGGVLLLVGVLGKVAAGFAPPWFRGRKLLVGVAMIPRGEVGLIFAQMGLRSGVLSPGLLGALTLTVLGTTLVTPPALGRLANRRRPGRSAVALPGDGGIDDLVYGTVTTREEPVADRSCGTANGRRAVDRSADRSGDRAPEAGAPD